MKFKTHTQIILLLLVFFCSACKSSKTGDADRTKPNVVIIFLDDSGYSDYSPFNTDGVSTPNVQNLANEGVTYTNFYVPQAICSASRAALLTGCYPGRTKVFSWLSPGERGLERSFPTIAEIFKTEGYRTALFGKWHCGDQPDTRPHARGFEETCGLMYSNDMWKHHPEDPETWGNHLLPYYENGKVTIEDVDIPEQKQLTKWYTEHAVEFIRNNKNEPFLLYVPHSMPHVPIFCSEEFEGISGKGLYGDVIMELDWSVGQITKALKDNGLEENTIVVFTSDNGPWTSYGNHAGTTPFREAKATSFDGGIRSACIIRYPQELKAGEVSDKTFYSIDILPTLCHLAAIKLPAQEIDGKNVWPLISGVKDAENPHSYYAISTYNNLEGIMSADGKWKLHLAHDYRTLETPGKDGMHGKYIQKQIELSLFDMEHDPFETLNVKDAHPDVVKELSEFAREHESRFYEAE